jgi:hypothetical protein
MLVYVNILYFDLVQAEIPSENCLVECEIESEYRNWRIRLISRKSSKLDDFVLSEEHLHVKDESLCSIITDHETSVERIFFFSFDQIWDYLNELCVDVHSSQSEFWSIDKWLQKSQF